MENLKRKIENGRSRFFRHLFFFIGYLFSIFLLAAYCLPITVSAQKIAVLTPDKSTASRVFAEKLENAFPENVKILDDSLSDTAFRAQTFEKPFNLSLAEAKNIGAAIGTDFFLLLKAENLRRASFAKGEFYESYAVVFTVSTRTGRLILWKLNSFETEKKDAAEKKLFDSIQTLAAEITEKINIINKKEFGEKPAPNFEELPEENSAGAKDFRPPLPYKRLRPAYTTLANLYSIEATVDVEADIDETGRILKAETVRWAGFGLDESATENVSRMNWRPAERSGKTLPIRVLLRYNFKKIEGEKR